MANKELQDQRLDQIGIDLINAGKLDDGQIGQIATSSDMFRAIRQRIAAGGEPPRAHRGFVMSNLRFSLAAYAILAVIIFGAVLAAVFERRSANPPTARVPVHGQPDRILQPFDQPMPKEVSSPEVKDPPVAQHAVLRSRQRPADHHRRIVTEEVSEFYPLTNYGDEHDDGGQLVRVRLPRAALLSMGVESPFETAPGTKVKTDLLIGSDGVMKAVRFVK